jgi:hypothetical protein
MRVNRRLLYWGVVLVAIGGVLVAADLGAIETATLADVLRLWPLAIVAIGLSLVLRRTQIALPAMLAAALIPGLVVGSAFAIAPRFAEACDVRDQAQQIADERGTFDEPAVVSVRSGCGVLRVTTEAGSDWHLDVRGSGADAPNVNSTGRSLAVNVPGGLRWSPFDGNRAAWNLTLPTSELRDLSFAVFAADALIDLPNADVGRLDLTVNAARTVVDLSEADVVELDATINVSQLVVTLPGDSDLTGTFRVGASDLEICVPPNVGLRLTARGNGEHVVVGGVEVDDGAWLSPNYQSATHHADLTVRTNFGAVDINPIGGCE